MLTLSREPRVSLRARSHDNLRYEVLLRTYNTNVGIVLFCSPSRSEQYLVDCTCETDAEKYETQRGTIDL